MHNKFDEYILNFRDKIISDRKKINEHFFCRDVNSDSIYLEKYGAEYFIDCDPFEKFLKTSDPNELDSIVFITGKRSGKNVNSKRYKFPKTFNVDLDVATYHNMIADFINNDYNNQLINLKQLDEEE